MISRECIYYINLRQAYLLSPFYVDRLSSRTVLYMNVPREFLDENRLRWMLGGSVKRIWMPQTTDELERLVKERQQTAMRLEKAEFSLIRLANAARTKALKKAGGQGSQTCNLPSESERDLKDDSTESITESGTADTIHVSDHELKDDSIDSTTKSGTADIVQVSQQSEATSYSTKEIQERTLPDVNGSVASQWISHSSRPRHRPIANYGRQVDTIKWTRNQVKKLNSKIAKVRHDQLFKTESLLPSVFVEFETMTDAQDAFQTLTHHRPLHMAQRYIGVRPFEILWDTLSMSWLETIARRFLVKAFITALIVFWAIPSAIVGMVSNIQTLSEKVPFLGWIDDLPSVVLGVLSGVIPAFALSLLMSIVPGILRCTYRVRLRGVSANCYRLRKAKWRAYSDWDRALHSTCLLRLPDRPSLSNHYIIIGSLGSYH